MMPPSKNFGLPASKGFSPERMEFGFHRSPCLVVFTLFLVASGFFRASQGQEVPPIPKIERKLPPIGKPIGSEMRAAVEERWAKLAKEFESHRNKPYAADIGMLLKGVRFALDLDEFYKEGDEKKLDRVLAEAEKRMASFRSGKTPWTQSKGLVVRGFQSKIDQSYQPYGVVVPESINLTAGASAKVPAILWLHGRGDSETDLHFLDNRMRAKGQVASDEVMIIHAFGRQCLGFKSAGETDVLECLEHALANYPIDPDGVILMGFSMGGAGAWHLGAHYVDRWVAVSPGAGFADTARYQNLDPQKNYPSVIEQTLWGNYDVPNYVRNLFNLPVIAYSGSDDKQIQAARLMEEAFEKEGRKLDHRIGPGMGHKYHPDVLANILKDLIRIAKEKPSSRNLYLQTRTLRYSRIGGIEIEGLEEHWKDSRITAEPTSDRSWNVSTQNIRRFTVDPSVHSPSKIWNIDGTEFPKLGQDRIVFEKGEQGWKVASKEPVKGLAKRPKLQGPIDDAFLEPFVVVTPTGKCRSAKVEEWVQFELDHLRDRWKGLYRGELPEVKDSDLTQDAIANKHLVLFGDPESNRWIKKFLDEGKNESPLSWDHDKIKLGTVEVPAAYGVPLMIYPNLFAPNKNRYVVFNSGPTFREAQDRTNSLQNPRLGDWTLLDIRVHPNADLPGKVLASGIFGESWEFKKAMTP